MSTLLELDTEATFAALDVPAPDSQPVEATEAVEPRAEVKTGRVAAAAGLSTLAAVWLTAHVFHGVLTATFEGALAVALGVGMVYLSTRLRRPTTLQYAVLPAAAALGALLATTGPGGGSNLPGMVEQTLRAGGLQNPPIPFDGGWRFLLVVLFACLAAVAAVVATSAARPKLAVGIPSALTVPATLLQPKGSQILPTVVAVVLVAAAMALAFGADLAARTSTGAGFEARRLARGAILLAGSVVALIAVSQSSFLFPATQQSTVIPPRKPPPATPLPPDQVLFSVHSPGDGPWRLGVLDSYGDNAFLLPSVDARRLHALHPGDSIAPAGTQPTYDATFTVRDLHGQTLPSPAGITGLTGVSQKLTYDPETGLAQLAEVSLQGGLTYTVTAVRPPSGAQLRHAPAPDPTIAGRYTALPPPPLGVLALLAKAPKNPFDRLQFVRSTLLSTVVAAGSGGPRDVLPADVDAMLKGGSANPYQIVAAQVMLARWAGIPARIGFGFYGGVPGDGGVTDFRPADGSAWLEAYFEGDGWVPIVGTPQKAQASLSRAQRKSTARPTDQLALSIYLPVRQVSIQLLYEVVRYYALRALAILLPLVALVVGYPAALKQWRRRRRRRWAARHGLSAQVMVSYADLRDRLYDLNVGDPRATPLEFLRAVTADQEHEELAWLVTRAVWGDLARDLREEDVTMAEDMARSVRRRVVAEQPALNRFVAAITRTSLRDPWSDELPNVWWKRKRATVASRRVRVRRRFPLALPGRA